MKIFIKMNRSYCLWWCYILCINFLADSKFASAQTTTSSPGTDFTTTENPNTAAATFSTTASITTEDEGTTLTAADSALPTSTVANENILNDATTILPGYELFESQRQSANQEVESSQESSNVNSGKSGEKNNAWKYTRGGNNQGVWSRPSTNNAYPQWQKEVSQPASPNPEPVQSAEGAANKNNEQQYVVWQQGQNNQPGGWTLEGLPEGWINSAPDSGSWAPDSAQVGINSGAWNAAQWTNVQSPVSEDSQAEYQEEENASNDNEASGWNNAANGGWVGPVNNAGGWANPAAITQNGNVPPTSGWAPQNPNAPVQNEAPPQISNAPLQNGWTPPNQNPTPPNGWSAQNQNPVPPNGWAVVSNNPAPNSWPSQAVNVPQNGWTPPVANVQPQNGWAAPASNPQSQSGWAPGSNAPSSNQWPTQQNAPNIWKQAQPANPGAGWTQTQQTGNTWQTTPQQAGPPAAIVQPNTNVGWNQNAGGSWAGPQTAGRPNGKSGAWNSGPSGIATWNNGQPNVQGWSNGETAAGAPDPALSWKVYNEDTQTMENLDDNLGWKVVGDGGTDGWKLVDENGNIEWKIENINGEWKVTSADETPKQANVTSNITQNTNSTTASLNNITESSSTTPSPVGGWDDTKQGRYIVWKFSEDGKGEARVYSGGGAEPDVWTVGDNNQWWQQAVAGNGANNAGPWSANAKPVGNTGSNNQNSKNGSWNADKGRQNPTKSRSEKNGARGSSQNNNKRKNQINTGPSQTNSGSNTASEKQQQGNNAVPQTGTAPVGWSNGNNGPQIGNNQWQSNTLPAAHTTTWNNRGSNQNGAVSWQNQQQQPLVDWSAGNVGQNNPNIAQAGWKQEGASTAAGGGNINISNDQRSKARGKPKNRVRNGPPKTWRPSSDSNQNAGGTSWRNANGGNPKVQNAQSNSPPSNPWNNPAQGGGVTGGNGLLGGWPINTNGGQNVPYVIIIKTPQVITSTGDNSNPWASQGINKRKSSRIGATKPQANRRENDSLKINKAGSSGWQWNPQGSRNGWTWNEGWMGSGGGFGGWVKDGNSMYTNWRPTKNNGTSLRPANKRIGANSSKNNGSKMVFVFGSKKGSKGNKNQPSSGRPGKGKQVIIIDYTTGKKVPKTDENMKKDIETVIQALKSARPTGIKGSVSLDSKTNSQN